MRQPIRPITAEILNVSDDAFGPYLKMRVVVSDGSAVIRWGIDQLTYGHLRKLVFTQQANVLPSTDYRCELDVTTRKASSNSPHRGTLSCLMGAQWIRLEFICSDLFAANLAWLSAVRRVEDLRPLIWDTWLRSEYPLQYLEDIPSPGASSRFQQLLTFLGRPQLFIAAALLFCSLLVAQWVNHGHREGNRASRVPPRKVAHAVTSHPAAGIVASTIAPHAHGVVPAQHPTVGTINPARATTSASTRRRPKEIYQVPRGEVALTFDDGPSPYTEGIIQVLNHYHIRATFFLVGYDVLARPTMVRDIAENHEGMGVQTVDHGDLTNMSPARQTWDIMADIRDIRRASSVSVVLIRPPYDAFNETTRRILAQHHLFLTLWNRDPRDWAANSPTQVIHAVLGQSASGGVFVLHERKNTLLALPAIIRAMSVQHLKFVVVSPTFE